jgi:spore maturation protein CgeB
MLRVLYLPLGEQSGTTQAFKRLGVDLNSYDFWSAWQHNSNKDVIANEFLQRVRTFKPQLIHMQLQFTGIIEPHTLNEARKICPGVIITNWSGDCRANVVSDFTKLTNSLDYSLMSSTGHLAMYRNAGCHNIRYWQIGYDPTIYRPLHYSKFQHDAVFAGNNYGNTFPDSMLRTNAISFLSAKLPTFKAYGAGYPGNSIDPRQMNEVYNKTICPISISNFNNVGHYFSDRLLYCVASGRPTISWYFPGIESYFIEGSEIFIAKSNQDILDLVNYCKENPDVATQVGINGARRVAREHTYDSRIIELLTMTNLVHLV